ncbi:hypothetical protein [Bacillus toyonensis]|uniref:hypothetical protein n=1 Tax=Bacillus toyonensis TaxID=155322 RepID=UPI000BFD8D46|nr:hypothetical protein [Bacillus toyonensis]PHC14351.1 hypothetical protein COF03_24890 [Bacillus toyonensis]
MDAFKSVVYRYGVYLAVLFLGGPLLLLLLVYAGDIFVAYMSYGLDKLNLEGFMIMVYLMFPLIFFGGSLMIICKTIEYLLNKNKKKEKTP